MTTTELTALLAPGTTTADLLAAANKLSMRPVRSRAAALRVIEDELALVATYDLMGRH